MSKLKIQKGDTVRVITGKDKGKEGKVLSVDARDSRVIVEGVNMVTKATKANGADQGGLVHREAPIHISNVMLVAGGKPTRVGFKVETTTENDKKVVKKSRVAKATGDTID